MNLDHRRRRSLLAVALFGSLGPSVLRAANIDFPRRPVKLIVPYTAGGASEVAARAVAEAMRTSLGQPVIIDNRPGADGAIAVQAGITAAPDGHTLVLVAASMAALPIAVKPPPFTLKDLAPVSLVGDLTFGLFVPASLPVKSTRELLEYARSRNEPLAYASISLSMDALSYALAEAGGFKMTRIPYKGGPQAMADLVGGHVQVFLGPIGNGMAATKEGRVRLLATYPQRSRLAPEVPTLSESGVGTFTTPTFMLFAVPAATPRPVVDRLSQAVNNALTDQQVRERLESLGIAPQRSTPDEAAEQLRRAQDAFAPAVRSLEVNSAR